jgi:triacylglycerol lipase
MTEVEPQPGTNVLVLAPSLSSEKYETCLDLFTVGSRPTLDGLYTSYSASPAELVERWQETHGELPGRMGIVTVGTQAGPGPAVVAGGTAPAETGRGTHPAGVRPSKPRDIEADLAEPETAFDAKKGYWLAEAAHLAYQGDPDQVTKVVRDQWFFDEVSHFDDGRTTQAFLAASRRIGILAFRGTEGDQFNDWVTDARFKPEDFQSDYGKVHRGFREALNSQYEAIEEAIRGFQGSGRLLYITGHSLGAALATLMASRLAMEQVYPVQAVYTFGSPRVGDSAFAAAYARELGERTFRVVNHDDLVTRVPTRSLGYRHVGQVIYFDADGAMHQDVGYRYRFLNLLANAVEDYKKAARTSIADHSMALYLKRFRGWSEESGGS